MIIREPGGIAYADQLAVIASEPALRTMTPARGVNPFSRAPMDYHRPYAARVCADGGDVGSMIWEANHNFVSGSFEAVAPLARVVAERLHARFVLNADLPEEVDDQ